MTRTTSRTVRFTRPFVLDGVEGEQPPGTYEVETDEELLPGLSFPAYRRIETRICLPLRGIGTSGHQTVAVDPAALEAAQARDAADGPAP